MKRAASSRFARGRERAGFLAFKELRDGGIKGGAEPFNEKVLGFYPKRLPRGLIIEYFGLLYLAGQ